MKKAEIRETNRAKAINVMKKCMLKYGIVATTKDLVAQKSNLSMASIVRYFRTKDNMVLIVKDELEKKFNKIYGPIIEGKGEYKNMNGAALFREFGKVTVEEFVKDPELFALNGEIVHYLFRHENDGVMLMEGVKNDMAIIRCLTKIYNLGKEDGSLALDWAIDEEVYFTLNLVHGAMINVGYVSRLCNRDEKVAQKEHIARLLAGLYAKYAYGADNEAVENVRYMAGDGYLK